ncbi:MAG: ATP-binding cassette domain-containing protein [Armatimonadetes bacterium]|nr:ATP-binding cassette domain-containing protein [Armatimonadota bacterium]
MSEPLLALEAVTRRFGGMTAVDGLSAEVRPGRVTALIGPNGAGKSTLLDLIAGRRRPDAGRVLFRGAPLPLGAHRAARAGIGRLFQEVRVFRSMSVTQNVLCGLPGGPHEGVWAALAGRRRDAQALAAAREQIAFVGLTAQADVPAGSLSYGQQKLAALARLLASGAELLLLDEPASGIHPRLVDELAELLGRIVSTGRTVLLVEHNLVLVRRVADEVILLDRGRCRASGPVAEVWDSPVMREVYLAAEPA